MIKRIRKHYGLPSRTGAIKKAVWALDKIISKKATIIAEDGKTEIVIL